MGDFSAGVHLSLSLSFSFIPPAHSLTLSSQKKVPKTTPLMWSKPFSSHPCTVHLFPPLTSQTPSPQTHPFFKVLVFFSPTLAWSFSHLFPFHTVKPQGLCLIYLLNAHQWTFYYRKMTRGVLQWCCLLHWVFAFAQVLLQNPFTSLFHKYYTVSHYLLFHVIVASPWAIIIKSIIFTLEAWSVEAAIKISAWN